MKSSIINERISEVMKQRGLTQAELIRRSIPYQQELGIDLSRGALSQYLNNKSSPDRYKLLLLSKTLNVSIEWLMGYDTNDSSLNQDKKIKDGMPFVFVNSILSAGTGIIDFDPDNFMGTAYVSSVPPHDLAFFVDGDSMKPLFSDGEIVFVEKTVEFHNGQIIAIQIGDHAYIKKAYSENGQLRLVSLNPDYEEIVVKPDSNIYPIGKVII